MEFKNSYNTVKVGNYLSFKDAINTNVNSCLVYRFTCLENLDTPYIGETECPTLPKNKRTSTSSSVFNNIKFVDIVKL